IQSNTQIQRRKHGPSNERASESDVAAVRGPARAKVERSARLVLGKLPCENCRRFDTRVSSRQQGKYLHAHGVGLLGDGGQHREPRADRRRVLLRKQRGTVGCLGTGEARDRRVARHVQQSELPRQPRDAVQSPGGLERKAQPRIQRSHPQSARANATGDAGTKGAGRRQLEPQFARLSVTASGCGARPKLGRASAFTWLKTIFGESREAGEECEEWQRERWKKQKSCRGRTGRREV